MAGGQNEEQVPGLDDDDGDSSRRTSASTTISETVTSPLQVYGLPLLNAFDVDDGLPPMLAFNSAKTSFIPYPQMVPTTPTKKNAKLPPIPMTPTKRTRKSPRVEQKKFDPQHELLKTPILSPSQVSNSGMQILSSSPFSGPSTPALTSQSLGQIDEMFLSPAKWASAANELAAWNEMANGLPGGKQSTHTDSYGAQDFLDGLLIDPFLLGQDTNQGSTLVAPSDLSLKPVPMPIPTSYASDSDASHGTVIITPDMLGSDASFDASLSDSNAQDLSRFLFGGPGEDSLDALLTGSPSNRSKRKRSRSIAETDDEYEDDGAFDDDGDDEYRPKRRKANGGGARRTKRAICAARRGDSRHISASSYASETFHNATGPQRAGSIPLSVLCALYEPVDLAVAGGTGGNYRCLYPGCTNTLQPTKTAMHSHITSCHDLDHLTPHPKAMQSGRYSSADDSDDDYLGSPHSSRSVSRNVSSNDGVTTTTTTGTRIFRCKTCHQPFIRHHDLRRHERTHSGSRDFVCPCGKGFARGDALGRHRQRGICQGSTVPLRKGFEHFAAFMR